MFLHLKILDIRINAGLNYFLCFFSRLNLCYGCSFVMLKSFVNLKEMLDFVKSVARNLVNIFIAIVVGVVNRNCDDFSSFAPLSSMMSTPIGVHSTIVIGCILSLQSTRTSSGSLSLAYVRGIKP